MPDFVGGSPLAPPEQPREVSRSHGLNEAGLPAGRVAKHLHLDLGDGGARGDQLVDVVVTARLLTRLRKLCLITICVTIYVNYYMIT